MMRANLCRSFSLSAVNTSNILHCIYNYLHKIKVVYLQSKYVLSKKLTISNLPPVNEKRSDEILSKTIKKYP